jgi:argininosuccinate lyase
VGGKLHTARSRNDQVALDIRMYLRDEIAKHDLWVAPERSWVLRPVRDVVLPARTCNGTAQPWATTCSPYEMFERPRQARGCFRRVNVLLGAGRATVLPIDQVRRQTAGLRRRVRTT